MPPTPYRPTGPPDSPLLDPDSDVDLDLDLEELDPATSSSSVHGSRLLGVELRPEQRTPPIALRSLRMSGLRRSAKRNRGYGELGRDRIGGEDAMALVDDEAQDQRYSDASGTAGDDAPLLREQDAHPPRRSAGGLQASPRCARI